MSLLMPTARGLRAASVSLRGCQEEAVNEGKPAQAALLSLGKAALWQGGRAHSEERDSCGREHSWLEQPAMSSSLTPGVGGLFLWSGA